MEEIRNYQVDRKYRVTFEKAAGVKTGDGFKVEANGDDMQMVITQAQALYEQAKALTKPEVTGTEL